MKEICQDLYERMIASIDNCVEKYAGTAEYIACCFSKSETLASELEQVVKGYKFTSQAEEIWYYKSMKPQFYALAEFFSLMYKGEVFIKYENNLAEYWKEELRYIQRFFKKHETFYCYYKTGMTHMDTEYFLQKNSMDKLVASLMAREKYIGYVEEKLRMLEKA